MTPRALDQLCIDTLRFLSVDMVEHAKSGHPGLPMGAAPIAYVLWTRFLRHNPANPHWWDRDRFVLSAGHGSALLYALLHVTGYDLPVAELERFRQWGSRTPGHPESHLTAGVEASTGPLGQGLANAVGMTIAEAHLAARYNRDGRTLWNHSTYVLDAIDHAIREAQEAHDRPSLIAVRTVIGYGAPDKQGTFAAHGSPLGDAEVARAKEQLGWPAMPRFFVPDEARVHFQRAIERGAALEAAWRAQLELYTRECPELARELERRFAGELAPGLADSLPTFEPDPEGLATRKASERVMQAIASAVPSLVGGSADLDPSTFTWLRGDGDFESVDRGARGAQGLVGGGWSHAGRNVHYGVREHAMAAATNGLVYHGGFIPFASTFLVFSDYMRPAIRLAALARLRSIFVFTHDSIALGEDGPSHQPIEQVAALRAIPGLLVIRPSDANETRVSWQIALEEHARPTVLVLTRQKVPTLDRSRFAPAELVRRGAYVLDRAADTPDIILIASGSEVGLIAEAQPILRAAGVRARLVSMPCWRLFEEQPASYRDEVLPARVTARVAVEAGSPLGWERWTGRDGAIIGIDRFGASAPGEVVLAHYGFTVDNVVDTAMALIGRHREAR